MCGLVGIAGDTTGSWKDLFAELLLFDVLRGPHSTGAGFVGRANEEFSLAKRAGHPFNLFAAKEYADAMDSKNSVKVVLGHNRYATIGEKSETNAHPFAFKNVMGMHNGTLEKWSHKDMPDALNYDTDSEAIFASIEKIGLKETLKFMFGAWALIWFDKRNHTLNFLNNGRRPLHYCYSSDRCTMIWASEIDMLKYLMDRRNKKADNNEFYTTNKDVHYSWKIPASINKKFDPPEQQQAEGRAFSYQPFKAWSPTMGATGTTNVGTKHSTHWDIIPFDKRLRTNKFRPPYKDMYGKVISKAQFTRLVKEGCCFCGTTDQEWGEFIQLMAAYTDHNTPFTCEQCFNDADLYDYTQYAV